MIQLGSGCDYSTEKLKSQLSCSFPNFEVETVPALENPSDAYDSKRRQYHSTRILVILENHVPNTRADRLLALTAFDIYVPGMNYVFGQARCPGHAAVVSTRRLKPSLGKPASLLARRVLKEAVHETGHMLGLKHCKKVSCVMYFSEDIKDTDRKDAAYCQGCQAKLKRRKFE